MGGWVKRYTTIMLMLVTALVIDWATTIRFQARGGEAWAADCQFVWKAVSGATGYELEYSTDQGATWTGRKATGALTPDANGDVIWTYTGVPETGLVLFRVSATNATGRATRLEYGAWYNHKWKPMASPAGGGITNP